MFFDHNGSTASSLYALPEPVTADSHFSESTGSGGFGKFDRFLKLALFALEFF